jgi:tripartite-type tricarboxylate transporter receptor subunit TctC
MKRISCLLSLALLFAFAAAICESEAMAQPAAEFYKGKTITIIEGFGAGSDFDMEARMIAPFLQKATGTHAIAVENKAGAAGTIARNYLFTAKNDGLTIMLDHGPRLVSGGLFNSPGVKYEWKKFVWIGKLLQEDVLVAVDKKLPWTKPQDLVGKTYIMGVSRPFYESLLAEALGWGGTKLVPGYQSPSERAIAIARGEIQASIGNSSSFISLWDTVKPIVITFKHNDYPNIPTVRESAAPGREKWVSVLEDFQKIQYSFIAPPGTPGDRVKFIEDCLHKIYDDTEFRKKVDSLGWDLPATFLGSKELNEATTRLSNMSPEEIKELSEVIEKKYIARK